MGVPLLVHASVSFAAPPAHRASDLLRRPEGWKELRALVGHRNCPQSPVRQLQLDAAVAAEDFFAVALFERLELAKAGGDEAVGWDAA